MSQAPFISVEQINRKLYEAATNGLFVSLALIDAPEATDGTIQKAFDCLIIDGDGEKSYDLLLVTENADMVAEIRAFVAAKLEETTSRIDPYLIIEREDRRKQALRNVPLIRTRSVYPDYIITADDLTFMFIRDNSAPHSKGLDPYARFTYKVAGGSITGEVEIVGDHNPLYELAPVVEAHLRIRAVRKHLLKEIQESEAA